MSRRVDHHELGFQETLPENVPVGKISLRSALQMINDHRVEPAIYTIEASAEKYKMNLDLTREYSECSTDNKQPSIVPILDIRTFCREHHALLQTIRAEHILGQDRFGTV